jgi:predicted kinase
VLEARIAERRRAPDASEADHEVLAWQRAHAEPPGKDETLQIVSIDTARETAVSEALAGLAPG